MPKVTYLFGAGASAKCLPVVNEIPERLSLFYDFIQQNRRANKVKFDDLPCDITEFDGEEQLMRSCKELIDQVKKHASIDTYAKELFITSKREEYRILKVVLTCFFVFEQLCRPEDDRYDAFFASILGSHSSEFKGDIKILSWNYDFQFEKAYSQYSGSKDLRTNQLQLNIYPVGPRLSDYKDQFSIFKINGTTGFTAVHPLKKMTDLAQTFETPADSSLLETFVWYYLALVYCSTRVTSLLRFAWESEIEMGKNELLDVACNAVSGSSALVVIGYSFPFFNRDVDDRYCNCWCDDHLCTRQKPSPHY